MLILRPRRSGKGPIKIVISHLFLAEWRRWKGHVDRYRALPSGDRISSGGSQDRTHCGGRRANPATGLTKQGSWWKRTESTYDRGLMAHCLALAPYIDSKEIPMTYRSCLPMTSLKERSQVDYRTGWATATHQPFGDTLTMFSNTRNLRDRL